VIGFLVDPRRRRAARPMSLRIEFDDFRACGPPRRPEGPGLHGVRPGTAFVDCSPAEVGSSPSSEQQVADFMNKESESS
jgi:hypothetical protein